MSSTINNNNNNNISHNSNKINKETFCLIDHINKLVLNKIKEENNTNKKPNKNITLVKSKNQLYDPSELSPFAFYLTKELPVEFKSNGDPKTLEQFDNLTLSMIWSCGPHIRNSKNVIKLI